MKIRTGSHRPDIFSQQTRYCQKCHSLQSDANLTKRFSLPYVRLTLKSANDFKRALSSSVR